MAGPAPRGAFPDLPPAALGPRTGSTPAPPRRLQTPPGGRGRPAHLDGGVVLVHEVVLDELDGERALADAAGSDHHQLVLGHGRPGPARPTRNTLPALPASAVTPARAAASEHVTQRDAPARSI